ncbi:class D beta-lactamase [Chitiniphilus eburneus]|uniref:Beta-lactamase n=1 Tax=Chitiniphilus eburneus TaxID=2571148 RepID=A0A4U0QCP3_9NEIS|nr:class D beta-lactamase [Chitiniphilus eburneus]TJZ79189.1 class D beta-lactamase [Chitiniphilus eburneus]
MSSHSLGRWPRLWLFLAACAVLALSPLSRAAEPLALASLFQRFGVTGTFVLYDAQADTLRIYNPERAARRIVPASTFKIPNSLIALETGVVRDLEQVLPYGGKPQRLKQWEQDLNLRDAIRVSSVPIYQGIARRVGPERMAAWVKRLGYGNMEIGIGAGRPVDRFWLQGPLKISAVEEARFVARLARGELPASQRNQQLVRDILKQEDGDGYVLYGKTGWYAPPQGGDIGWWVGWVEKAGRIHAFALNIDLPDEAAAAKRVPLARAALQQAGIL